MQPGERIRAFRKGKGLTQKELADALGYSDAFLSEIERGVSGVSREFLKKLNEVFGISSDLILYGGPPDQVITDVSVHQEIYTEGEKKVLIIREPESKYQILPTATKKILASVVEILESGNEVMADALKANIKAFLEAVRIKKKNNEDKFKGGD